MDGPVGEGGRRHRPIARRPGADCPHLTLVSWFRRWDAGSTLRMETGGSMKLLPRRVTVLGAACVLTVALGGAALADSPQSGPGGRGTSTLTVSPSDNPSNVHVVQVSGTNFPLAGRNPALRDRVVLRQCFLQETRLLCGPEIGSAVPDSSGSFGPVSVTVTRTFTADTAFDLTYPGRIFEPIDPIEHTCTASATDCFLSARLTYPPSRGVAQHHLSFAQSSPEATRKGKGCGDKNHVHQRLNKCVKQTK